MKTKIYLVISSIISIIVDIYTMIIADSIVKSTIESIKQAYSSFPQSFQDRALSLITKGGPYIIMLMSLFAIIASVAIIYMVVKDVHVKNKGIVIALSILQLFNTSSIIVMLLSIINIIVMCLKKRERVKDFKKKEDNEIPKLKRDAIDWDGITSGVLILAIFIIKLISNYFVSFDAGTSIIIGLIYNAVMLVLCISSFFSVLKRDLKIFISNFKKYMKYIFPRIGITYVVFIITSLISILITKNATSTNQVMLEELPKYYLIPLAIFVAPVIEELIFRGIFRRLIRNDIAFIIVSALVFGLLHSISESNIISVFVVMVPYSVMGGFLAYIYVKTNNICSNIFCHSFWNTVASIIMLFM